MRKADLKEESYTSTNKEGEQAKQNLMQILVSNLRMLQQKILNGLESERKVKESKFKLIFNKPPEVSSSKLDVEDYLTETIKSKSVLKE
jgi:hypothetical protein